MKSILTIMFDLCNAAAVAIFFCVRVRACVYPIIIAAVFFFFFVRFFSFLIQKLKALARRN
jgi:hypothetical protein